MRPGAPFRFAVIMTLMSRFAVDKWSSRHGIDFDHHSAAEPQRLAHRWAAE